MERRNVFLNHVSDEQVVGGTERMGEKSVSMVSGNIGCAQYVPLKEQIPMDVPLVSVTGVDQPRGVRNKLLGTTTPWSPDVPPRVGPQCGQTTPGRPDRPQGPPIV